ncbi:odorant receptor 49a [Spodoptera frugiperda]|uniref:Odorant receptor n=1 Tax=Spodoptera frugiperda TaxID=7108 RepID=A0A9R0DCB7_SPOFR|nr:odorant receptor 49a [Spodoptera frugiperda]
MPPLTHEPLLKRTVEYNRHYSFDSLKMKSAAIDLSRHISLQIGALKLFEIWFYIPYNMKDVRFWVRIWTRIVLGIIVFVIPTGSQLIYAVRLIMSGNAEIQEVAGIINLILTELLVSLRLLDLSLRRHRVSQLAEQLKCEEFQFHSPAQKRILEKAVESSRRLFWILLCSCSSDVLVHVVVVPALHNFQTLPLKMDLVYLDVNKESYFNYLCAYQILYKPMMLATFAAVQTLPWATMTCAISQLDVLIYNLENIQDLVKATVAEKQCTENEAFRDIFKGCVLHHCSIIKFVNTIQNAFGGQLSATLCLSTGILGTTAVQMLSIESPLKNLTEVIWVLAYLSIFICNLFIDCYFGNTITVKSMHVSTVIFSCPWIELPTTLKKNLVIFIAKTQRPLVITAAKLVPVSLDTFTKVMNWTYKAFAVMNQMKN